MNKINHILVPTDFSDCADNALGHAMVFAERYGAQITVLHVVTVFDDDPYNPEKKFTDVKEYFEHLEVLARGRLQNKTLPKQVGTTRINYVIRRGFSPAEMILDYASEYQVDFITIGTHGRHPLAHLLIGSVAEKVVQNAKCPVLTTRVTPTDFKLMKGYKKIIVATDFSEQSTTALKFAADVAGQDSQLNVLHVVNDSVHPAYYLSGKTSIFDLLPDLRKRSKEALEKFVTAAIPKDKKTKLVLKEGRPSKKIVEHSEEINSDLIVMGTRGLSDLEQFFIGSVADRVIRKANTPVIVVK